MESYKTNLNISEKKKNVLMTHYECVGEFHDTFGHPQKTEPYEDCFESEPKLITFRHSLMAEELKEFEDAYENHDLIEMADALADLSYVTNGAGQSLGLNLDELLKQHKLSIQNKQPFKVLVPSEDIFDNPKSVKFIEISAIVLHKYLESFCSSADNRDLASMGKFLTKLLYQTYHLGFSLGFDMDKIFREVHRSNMTKVCSNEEDAKESVRKYIEDKRYSDPSYKTKGDYFVVYDAKTSKILKNYKWETPNIKQFI